MICPQCKDDYGDEGHTRCVDCGIDLVPAPPPEPELEPEYFKFEEVLRTYNAGDVAIVRSLLDDEDIPYYIHGENLLHPLVEPARLMVDHDSVETAKELLKDLILSITEPNVNRTEEDEEAPEN